MQEKKRDNVLDIAKGIAIILMVIGHCYSKQNIVLTLIYAFHMPVFFMISGIIYGRKIYSGGKIELKKQAKRLLIPYALFGMAFGIMITLLNHQEGIITAIGKYVFQIICLKGVSVEWYLPCIFLIEILFCFVLKISKPYRDYLNIFMTVIMFLVVCLFMKNNLIVFQRVIIGYVFFSVGVYSCRLVEKKLPIYINILLMMLFIFSACYNEMVSLVTVTLGNPFFYVLNGILGTFLLVRFSVSLHARTEKSLNWISEKLIYIGKSTLVILCTHMFYIEILRLLDYKLFHSLFKTFGLFEGPILGMIVLMLVMPVVPFIKNILSKITYIRG